MNPDACSLDRHRLLSLHKRPARGGGVTRWRSGVPFNVGYCEPPGDCHTSTIVTLTFWLYLRIPRVMMQDSRVTPGGMRHNPLE